MKKYKRTCEDELDWVVVDQLHKATLQMSNNCFEFKKICVGLIGAVLAILVKLNDNQLTHSYFFIPLLICVGFWIADSSAYYFQRKTRSNMNKKLYAIACRNSIENYQYDEIKVSYFGAIFNSSMFLYYSLVFISFIGWGMYLWIYK